MQTLSNEQATPTTWTIDSAHTSAGFSVRHLLVTNVRGVFKTVTGSVRYDAARPEATEIEVSIPVSSIDTREPQRDAHLLSADFFDAAQFPTLTFRATRTEATREGLAMTGALTMRGVTRDVTLSVTDITPGPRDFQGKLRLGASATARLKRSDFGISFNKVLEAGHLAIGDEVTLQLDVSLVGA